MTNCVSLCGLVRIRYPNRIGVLALPGDLLEILNFNLPTFLRNPSAGRSSVAWEQLERIRVSLGVPFDEWEALTRLTRAELASLEASRGQPPLSAVEAVAEALDLDPERILAGEVDIHALLAHRGGSVCHLPQRYERAAFSRLRTSSHLLDYVELHFGWRARQRILNRFQITDSLFLSKDHQINIRFLSDVCDLLHHSGVSFEQLRRMGMHSTIANYHSPLGEIFRQHPDPMDLWQTAVFELGHRYYDRNFIYRIDSLTRDELRLEAAPNPEVQEALDTRYIGSPAVCASKSGTIAALTTYVGLPSAPIRETRCIHRGDPVCFFVLDLQPVYEAYRRTSLFGTA